MANRCSDTIKQVRDELTKLNQLDLDNIISWFGRQIITDEIKQKVEPLLASINSAVEAVIGHLGKMIDYKNFNDQDDSSFYQIYNNYNLISGTIASAKRIYLNIFKVMSLFNIKKYLMDTFQIYYV